MVDDLKARQQAEANAILEEEKKQLSEREKSRQKSQKEEDEWEAKWKETFNNQLRIGKERLLMEAKKDEEEEMERIRKAEKEDDFLERELNKEAARLIKEAA
jgi:hypothetical protein